MRSRPEGRGQRGEAPRPEEEDRSEEDEQPEGIAQGEGLRSLISRVRPTAPSGGLSPARRGRHCENG